MYNYNSDISRCEPDYEVETNDESYEGPTWSSILNIWKKATNGTHNLLPQYNTISASTTATNLSDYQSNSTLYKNPRMATLSENLRINQPELEPLSGKKDEDGALQLNIDNDSESGESSWSELTTGEKFSRMYPQLIAAIAVSWISLTIGYASAYTSPAIPSMEKDLHVSPNEVSWICGLMPLGALGGGLLGGPLIEYLGRKKTLLVTDLLFLAAWAVNFFASDYAYMYVSRIIVGCSVGIASLTLPVYLGETIQPEVRGSLGLLPTAFGNIGILICFLMGTFLEWRYLAGIGGLLPVPFLLLFIWIIPETPRWYISKGKEEDSRKALQWLRSKNQNIDKEFMDLVRTQKEADNKNESMLDLFSRGNLKPLMICLGLMFFQQLSGINAVIFYTTNIFRESGSTLDPNICTLIVGIVNFISTFIATVLIDRLGRKILLYISSVSMIVTLGILGVYFFMLNVTEVDMSSYGIVPLVSFVVYVLGFSLGFGPIPWLMMGEILPARIRGPAASVSTAFNWSCTFIVTKAFLLVIDLLGMHGTFWLFGAIMVLALVFTILFVPETKGQTLEDIERKLAGIKVRRRSSIANFKSTPSSC